MLLHIASEVIIFVAGSAAAYADDHGPDPLPVLLDGDECVELAA